MRRAIKNLFDTVVVPFFSSFAQFINKAPTSTSKEGLSSFFLQIWIFVQTRSRFFPTPLRRWQQNNYVFIRRSKSIVTVIDLAKSETSEGMSVAIGRNEKNRRKMQKARWIHSRVNGGRNDEKTLMRIKWKTMNDELKDAKWRVRKSNGKKKRDEKEIICQKMDKSERGTNNKQLSFFKTGFRETRRCKKRDNKQEKAHHSTSEWFIIVQRWNKEKRAFWIELELLQ